MYTPFRSRTHEDNIDNSVVKCTQHDPQRKETVFPTHSSMIQVYKTDSIAKIRNTTVDILS